MAWMIIIHGVDGKLPYRRRDYDVQAPGVYTFIAATRDIRHLKGLVIRPDKPVSAEEMGRAIARRAPE